MNIDLYRKTGATSEAISSVEPLASNDGASGRPYQESLGELARQLAARFAPSPPTMGEAAWGGSRQDIKDLSRSRYSGFKDAILRRPQVAVVLSFCLGAVITTGACSLYYSHRDFFGQYFVSQAAEPSSLSTAPAPVYDSSAVAAVPLAPESYKERSARSVLVIEAGPVAPAQPPTLTGNEVSPGGDRALEAEDIRELQTLLQSLGLSPGPIDGISGPLTAAAVKRYQESKGQVTAGNIDRDLLKRLRQEVALPVSAAEVAARRPLTEMPNER